MIHAVRSRHPNLMNFYYRIYVPPGRNYSVLCQVDNLPKIENEVSEYAIDFLPKPNGKTTNEKNLVGVGIASGVYDVTVEFLITGDGKSDEIKEGECLLSCEGSVATRGPIQTAVPLEQYAEAGAVRMSFDSMSTRTWSAEKPAQLLRLCPGEVKSEGFPFGCSLFLKQRPVIPKELQLIALSIFLPTA